MVNGFQPQERNPIWALGIISIGLIIILGGVAWAWNSGWLEASPIGKVPIDPTTNKPSKETIIYGKINLVYYSAFARLVGVGDIFGLFGPQSRLVIDSVLIQETKAFSLSLLPLRITGLGEVNCDVAVIDPEQVAPISSTSVSVEPFGGIGKPDRASATFALKAYKNHDYKIKVRCSNTENPEDWAEYTKSYHTVE